MTEGEAGGPSPLRESERVRMVVESKGKLLRIEGMLIGRQVGVNLLRKLRGCVGVWITTTYNVGKRAQRECWAFGQRTCPIPLNRRKVCIIIIIFLVSNENLSSGCIFTSDLPKLY